MLICTGSEKDNKAGAVNDLERVPREADVDGMLYPYQ